MQAYYEWMQSTELTLTSKTGTFTVGETIVGATSGAIATVREAKTNSIVIKLVTRTLFNYGEIVNGQTSSATATVGTIKDNVGRASGNVINYKTLESSVDKYVDYLREELYPSIPATYYGDKRLVAQYFKDFYESKSNEQSYRFLFKLLYNEDIEFYYPGTDVLRVSDGNFEKTQIIRTIATATGIDSLGASYARDVFLFLNKTIRGKTSGFLANVVDIKKFFIGSREVAEMTLKLVSGTFTAGEDIVDIDDENLVTTIYGIVSGVTIIDGGSGYEDGDVITITGDGSEAQAKVSSIKESPISALTINTIGHGYQLDTTATINNSGTGGSGFIVKVTELANTYSVTSGANTYTLGEVSQVSIINRGEGYFKKPSITLQDTTISSLGLLSDKLITINNAGSNYGVGNTLVFTGGAGANVAGRIASVVETTTYDLLFEDGQQMLIDGSYDDIIKNEDWAVLGPIKRIELTNFGTGYSSANLPSITISTTTGSSANLIATNIQGKSANVTVDTSNNITGIGSIRAVEITNFGINYSAANASASAVGDGNAILSPVISGLGIKEGVWLDDDGKVDYKILQDSYYYQDYSYVIKSGLTFQTYSNTLKGIIHPAGLVYFGEIQILNDLNVASQLVNAEAIQRMLIQIFTHLTVGGQYEYSNITWTVKVEAPLINISTDLLDVQEYVIHLVPEGDEETGITDVAVTINEGVARNSFVIQTPFEIDVTATSATLPTTKFVIGHLDTLPGYGYNTYGDLPMTPFGVYGDDWSATPISVLQNIRFGDLYGENPAYQSIMNLYIDNTVDLSVSGITSKLKYETFAVSGTIPLLESIITTESLIIKPEIPIQLTLNDVGVSMSTVMDRELPVFVTLSDLNTYGEYVVIVSPTPSVVDVSVAASSILPQKFASAQNLISLYELDIKDVAILDVAGSTFNSVLPQNAYEGTIATFADSTFETAYLNYPLSFQEYVKVLSTTSTDLNNLFVDKEIVINSSSNGFKYTLYDDLLLSDYELTPISTLSDITFDTNFGTTQDDVTIKATTSPYTSGQSPKKSPTDIFRGKLQLEFKTESDGHALPYGDLPVSTLSEYAISDTLYDRPLSAETFGTTYPSIYTSSDYTTYTKIVGTVSSANAEFSALPISTFSSTPINSFSGLLLSDLVPFVVGSGTNFVSDFNLGSVFTANNEYFRVSSISNTTYMVTDRLPASAFSGVVAYRIPSPTYTFSSIPTSINEGANGTFNVTTTDIANGTALYWTINNVTTGSGDFV